jgi:DNA-directed RNA polymerase I, II, and III subunit RPABC5
MIIPIRCMGCGKLIADKWRHYQRELERARVQQKEVQQFMDGTELIKTPEGEILKSLGIEKLCCRIHFLTHRDLIDKI